LLKPRIRRCFYIRGIGTNLLFAGSDPDVTTQMDGVYLARAFEAFADYLDVDRVEVLRGPQELSMAATPLAVSVNIISKNPRTTLWRRRKSRPATTDCFRRTPM